MQFTVLVRSKAFFRWTGTKAERHVNADLSDRVHPTLVEVTGTTFVVQDVPLTLPPDGPFTVLKDDYPSLFVPDGSDQIDVPGLGFTFRFWTVQRILADGTSAGANIVLVPLTETDTRAPGPDLPAGLIPAPGDTLLVTAWYEQNPPHYHTVIIAFGGRYAQVLAADPVAVRIPDVDLSADSTHLTSPLKPPRTHGGFEGYAGDWPVAPGVTGSPNGSVLVAPATEIGGFTVADSYWVIPPGSLDDMPFVEWRCRLAATYPGLDDADPLDVNFNAGHTLTNTVLDTGTPRGLWTPTNNWTLGVALYGITVWKAPGEEREYTWEQRYILTPSSNPVTIQAAYGVGTGVPYVVGSGIVQTAAPAITPQGAFDFRFWFGRTGNGAALSRSLVVQPWVYPPSNAAPVGAPDMFLAYYEERQDRTNTLRVYAIVLSHDNGAHTLVTDHVPASCADVAGWKPRDSSGKCAAIAPDPAGEARRLASPLVGVGPIAGPFTAWDPTAAPLWYTNWHTVSTARSSAALQQKSEFFYHPPDAKALFKYWIVVPDGGPARFDPGLEPLSFAQNASAMVVAVYVNTLILAP